MCIRDSPDPVAAFELPEKGVREEYFSGEP